MWSKISRIFLLGLASVLLSGCGAQAEAKADDPDENLKIVCTIFPEYDWVRQISGRESDHTELTLLMKNGTDMHSYQPTV
ncbi:MAG TPA: zinc ABC transporter substrate-binding protein, partial [Lachnospiraceae bacterium]|nr:zinc ABC transporter substrate-binding protein [Lachnospiraceae bacterium]